MRYFLTLLSLSFVFFSCEANKENNTELSHSIRLKGNNWAEKLGYPEKSKVIILHADDIGMCSEANEAVKHVRLTKTHNSSPLTLENKHNSLIKYFYSHIINDYPHIVASALIDN